MFRSRTSGFDAKHWAGLPSPIRCIIVVQLFVNNFIRHLHFRPLPQRRTDSFRLFIFRPGERVPALLANHGASVSSQTGTIPPGGHDFSRRARFLQTGTISNWSRPRIGSIPTFPPHPISCVFGPPHLTAGASCDSVTVLPHVFSQWGNGKVVLWKLVTKALSCQAGVAFSFAAADSDIIEQTTNVRDCTPLALPKS